MEKKQLGKNKYSNRYSQSFKIKVCEAYLGSNFTKREIWEQYTGHKQEHGSLLKWLRELGYEKYEQKPIFVPTMKNNVQDLNAGQQDDAASLKQKVQLLEKQLEDEKLKSFVYSTMIDVAEKELKISIRKK